MQRDGVTVGWFVPTRAGCEHEVSSLRSVASALDDLLAAHSVSIDEVVAEYEAVRRGGQG